MRRPVRVGPCSAWSRTASAPDHKSTKTGPVRGIETGRLAGRIENIRNSIAPGSSTYEEAAAQAEQEQPGILQEISALMEQAVNAFEEGGPPLLP